MKTLKILLGCFVASQLLGCRVATPPGGAGIRPGPKVEVGLASEVPKATFSWDDLLNPREVAAGQFEDRQQATERNKGAGSNFTYTFTRVEYAGKTYWVSDAHSGSTDLPFLRATPTSASP